MSQRRSYKRWRDALRLEVMREHEDGGVKLGHIARAVVKRAMAGDMQAVREIGNRLDGRPVQRLELDGHVSLVGLLAELSGLDGELGARPVPAVEVTDSGVEPQSALSRGDAPTDDTASMPPRSLLSSTTEP